MDITKTLQVDNREDWRNWLKENSATADEIWLVYYRKEVGKPRIPYNDAVEEALCFGWIDSITKTIDHERYAQRYSPRKSTGKYSQTNKERPKRLLKQGKVISEVVESLTDVDLHEFDFPEDIMASIRENKTAWKNYQKFSGAYQRIRIAYIDGARTQPDEFEKRLAHFIKKTEQGKQFGFGIEEYY